MPLCHPLVPSILVPCNRHPMPPLGALHLGALQPSSATPGMSLQLFSSEAPGMTMPNALDRRYPMSIVPKKLRPPPPINVRLGQGLLTAGSVKGAAP
jgi:hypothetical protein